MPFERLTKYLRSIPIDSKVEIFYIDDNTTSLKPFFEERYDYNKTIEECILKLKKDSYLYSIFQKDYICANFSFLKDEDNIHLYNLIKDNVEILRYNGVDYYVKEPHDLWVNVLQQYVREFREFPVALTNTHSISTYTIIKSAFVKTNEFIGFVGQTHNKEYFKITPHTNGIQILTLDEIEQLKVEYIYMYTVPKGYIGSTVSRYLYERYPVYAPYYTANRIYLGSKFKKLSNNEIPIFPDMHIFPKLSEDTEFNIKKEGYMYMTVHFNK